MGYVERDRDDGCIDTGGSEGVCLSQERGDLVKESFQNLLLSLGPYSHEGLVYVQLVHITCVVQPR